MGKLDQQLKDKDYSGFLKEMEKCAKALQSIDPVLKNMVKSIFAEDEPKQNPRTQNSGSQDQASKSINKKKRVTEPTSAPSLRSDRILSTKSLFNDGLTNQGSGSTEQRLTQQRSRRISRVEEESWEDDSSPKEKEETAQVPKRLTEKATSSLSRLFGQNPSTSKLSSEYSIGYIAKYNAVKDLRQLGDAKVTLIPVDSFQAAWGRISHLLLEKESSHTNTAILYAIVSNIPLINIDWVAACIKARAVVDHKPYLVSWTPTKKLFEKTGIMICSPAKPPKVTQNIETAAEREKDVMEQMIVSMGGTVRKTYSDTTILVVQDHLFDWVRGAKAKAEIGVGYQSLKIVSKAWLVASVMENFVKNPDNPKFNLITQLIKE